MIFRRQTEPGSEVPPRSEGLRGRCFHDQHRSPNRANARDLGQALAAGVGAVPRHQPGFYLFKLSIQLLIVLAITDLSLAHRCRTEAVHTNTIGALRFRWFK